MINIKYKLYHLFLQNIDQNKKIKIFCNCPNSKEVIEQLKEYPLTHFEYCLNIQDATIVLNFSNKDYIEKKNNTYYLNYSVCSNDLAYTIISAYYKAIRRLNNETDYCNYLCI